MNINKFTLSKDHTKLIYEHEDYGGGCTHEFGVKTLLKVLKPVIKKQTKGRL